MTAPTSAPTACTLPADLVGASDCSDRGVDRLAERALVGDDGQPAGLDDLVGLALAASTPVDDLARQARGERARRDERDDPRRPAPG
jgi:hypothetical protein